MNKHLLAALAALAITGTVHASMIGDNLTIRRPYPNVATDYLAPVSTTVVAGATDAISPQPSLYTIDPESETIHIDFIGSSGFDGGASTFDGLQFLGFSGTLLNVSLVAAHGIGVVSLTHGADTFDLNLTGRFTADSYIDIRVEKASAPAAVPEPSAFVLMGLGLLGLLAYRTRAKNA